MKMAETAPTRTLLDFSPVKRHDADKENHVPVLSLIQFSKAPFVSFGTVKVGTSRSAVVRIDNPTEDAEARVTVEKIPSGKGFSVDHNTFTVQPEASFSLTVTWTPAEEGGTRELLVFSANGVLKHQAVLLGRAEAPKKKKKSLWDTIKNKKDGEKVFAPRGRKMEATLKMAANKTFQVSRKPQYKRDKPRSPLTSLNEGRAATTRSLRKHGSADGRPQKPDDQVSKPGPQQCPASSDQENVRRGRVNSPAVLLVPAAELVDGGNATDCPGQTQNKPDIKDLTKILNRTLSPIGTPEKFKRLMPRIQSESLVPVYVECEADAIRESMGTPVPSLKDALALIDSDLSNINTSPPDTSSSCNFSDSLESKSGSHVLGALPDSPEPLESNEPRLTFFVSTKAVASEDDAAAEMVKKTSFTTATVTKSKASAEENVLSGRKIRKSRRRLLEKTLELSDGGGQYESGPSTPQLPVIDPDSGTEGRPTGLCDVTHQVLKFTSSSPTPPVTSPLSIAATRFSFVVSSPPPPPSSVAFTATSPSPAASSSPLHLSSSTDGCRRSPAPTAQEDSFPIHVVVKSKKRRSEEFLRSDAKAEDAGKTDRVKRSKVACGRNESWRSERRSVSQRTAGSVRSATTSSLKTTRSAVPGQAKLPSSKFTSRGTPSLKSSAVRAAKVVAVAQSKLTFVKPLQTAIPRHPMPFAAKNMFYDERWIEKQERGFTWWINYVLTPDDFKVNTEVAKVNAVSLAMGNDDNLSVPKAPTKDQMSFSTYTARRKLNRLRRSACQLFTSEPMVRAIQRLELEVEAKRLLVRKDRHLWKDIGERKKVLNWLLSYNPLWLRIGLETIYGELISLESNSDVLGLAVFILRRLLWNPDIAAEFRHNKVPHLYKDGHEEALSRFTLKKLLLLVCFLDKAKESRLIEHDPCLFCVDAEFKTSKDLLLAFSRDFLSGEGILPRHLGYLGLHVSHIQTPLDEFEFAVKNLAVDLKCGIRLVRVMELLVQDWSLSAKLRLPAISRLQKVHNVDVTLQMLRNKGVDLKDEHGSVIDARDIVDGHREKTLSLLWKIIFTFHVEVILNEDQLREEISFLRRSRRTKRRLVSLRADRGPWLSPAKEKTLYEHSSTKITLLMDWVRTVCDFYNLKVENFTVAFSDGRVLCYLIHHYHPGLLPEEAVRHGTTQTVECSPSGRLELSCSASDSDSSFDCATGPMASPSVEFKELLENEKNNLRLVNTAVGFLGGVPAMINPADMSNTIPSEKVVMSYLTFLCARLLDLRNETRAARVIQDAWRKYRLKKDLQLYEERNSAAVKIQSHVRRFLHERRTKRQNQAAVLIQSVWRSYAARNRLRLKKEAQLRALQHKAAAVIQAQWRMFSALTTYQRLMYYTVVVQAKWRMRRAASAYGRLRWAAVVLQKHSRARALTMKDRESYLSLRAAVVKLQRGYRRWKTQKTVKENRAAAVIQAVFKKWYKQKMSSRFAAAVQIQSWYRKQRCLHQYRKLRRSIVFIQAQCKGHEQRRRFQMLKLQHHSAVLIQSVFRGHVARKQVAKMSCAAVVIQGWFRASVRRDAERQMFVSLRRAAVIIQATYRGKVARQELSKRHQAAMVIQAAFRKHAARRRYLVIRKAAAVIQQKYRATVLARKTMKDFESLRDAALTIQAAWRGRADRKRIEKQHQCATVIQAHYRRHKAQTEFRSQKAAAVVVQRHYRAHVTAKETRETFLCKREACVTLQAAFRGMRVRMELRKKHQAATVVQSAVRMFLCKKRYVLLQSAAVIVQSRYRALLLCRTQQHEYRWLKQATIKIQAVYRGFKVRKDLKKSHKAARAIQAHFRMHRARMAYLATKYAALIIQDRYRATILRDYQWQRYNTIKSAAVVIQAAYRGHLARRKVTEMHRAATVIQRKFLTMRERNKFLSVKAAAVVCQQRYRAAILVRKDRLDFLSKCRAVVCLQAAYRGYEVRKQLHIQHMAAVTIQSHFRTHQQRIRYKRLRWAVGVLQTRYRANQEMRREMHNLRAKRSAAVVLQAAYRGMKCRRSIKQQHRAADVIQRSYRAHCERRQYLALKSSVLSVQRRYRATVAAKQQMHRYQTARRAAVVLQAAFRGRQVRREIALWHQAATVIQSVYKKHRMEIRFQAMRLAAVIIQRRYRAQVLQRQDRENFLKMRRSAVVLQAAFRGQCVRNNISKRHRAASVIQTNYRRYKQQSAFRRQRWAAGVFQQRFRAQRRRNRDTKHYREVRNAVIRLQAAFRGMKCRQSIKQQHRAADVIQRSYRAHCERRQYLALKSSVLSVQRRYRATVAAKQQMHRYQTARRAAVVLQAAFRGRQVRREIALWHQAATVIQSVYKKHRMEIRFQAMRLAAVIIQRRYRAQVLQRQDRENFLKMRRSAVVLQAAFRGRQVRQKVAHLHQAATVIQSVYRRHREKVKFQAMHLAAVVIQRRYRCCILQRKERQDFMMKKQSTIILQAAFRGWCVRKEISRQNQAATVIQSYRRSLVQRRIFQRKREAVVTLQQRFRAAQLSRVERNNYIQTRRAAVTLQMHCRAWIARRKILEEAKAARRLRFTSAVVHHLSAMKIQRALRAHWALEAAKRQIHSVVTVQRWVRARQQRRRYLEDRGKVVAAQRAVKRWLTRRHKAAAVIQHAVRKFLLLRRQKKVQQGIVRAQALWRGHRSRQLNDNLKVVKLRHRLRQVSAAVRDEDKLCNKTSSALDYLLKYKHFSYILEALKNLETATRLSPECCERLVESDATNVIFTLIRCCNRSVPCMDVITFSIQILLNLSKYHKTIEAVYLVENSVETLLDLLQRYREKAGDKVAEKGGSIFTKACFLLALLLQDKRRAVDVMKLPKSLDKIRSIYRLTARKHKMDAERTVMKQKINASINGSFYVQATPRKSRPTPKFAPDWVLGKDKLKDIVDPLRAIQMVAETLSIAL